MNIHVYVESSYSNGPGSRFVIWTQGCSIKCKNCFNTDTHSFEKRNDLSINYIISKIKNSTNIEGVTISGGEPFDQFKDLFELVKKIKSETNLSILVYSGYSFDYITKKKAWIDITNYIDVLIDGNYDYLKKSKTMYKGSKNQNIYFFSEKYSKDDFNLENPTEFIIHENGDINITGFPT